MKAASAGLAPIVRPHRAARGCPPFSSTQRAAMSAAASPAPARATPSVSVNASRAASKTASGMSSVLVSTTNLESVPVIIRAPPARNADASTVYCGINHPGDAGKIQGVRCAMLNSLRARSPDKHGENSHKANCQKGHELVVAILDFIQFNGGNLPASSSINPSGHRGHLTSIKAVFSGQI